MKEKYVPTFLFTILAIASVYTARGIFEMADMTRNSALRNLGLGYTGSGQTELSQAQFQTVMGSVIFAIAVIAGILAVYNWPRSDKTEEPMPEQPSHEGDVTMFAGTVSKLVLVLTWLSRVVLLVGVVGAVINLVSLYPNEATDFILTFAGVFVIITLINIAIFGSKAARWAKDQTPKALLHAAVPQIGKMVFYALFGTVVSFLLDAIF